MSDAQSGGIWLWADDPPFGANIAARQVAIVTAWYRWRPVGVGGGGGQEAVVADVPSGRPGQTEILRAWQPADAWPYQRRSSRIVSVDNPPFSERTALTGILSAWVPGPPDPQRTTPKQIVSVDNPPVKGGDVRPAILETWEPDPPAPQEKTPTQIQSVDDPPRKGPARFDTTAWDVPAAPVQPQAKLPQGVAGADNPPFGARTAAIQVSISTAWYRWRPVGVGGGGAPEAAGDNPPFGKKDAQQPALRAYHAPDDIIEITLPGLAESVDNPPFDSRPKPGYWPILSSWQPGAPWPLQPRARVVAGVQADDPPFGSRDDLTGILRAWQPEDPYRQIRVNYPVQLEIVNDPPFGQRDDLVVLRAWQPGESWPQQLRPWVAGATPAGAPPPAGSRLQSPWMTNVGALLNR